ncbi:MAG: S8 family serine peptidase [Acidobacteria bacterium]|nr:S8 family serine peptidase [Acidobacteriota bacterium]
MDEPSPARVAEAITVGATDPSNDYRPVFSNVGAVLDLFAPGVNTTSAWIGSDTATNTISGTSMAAPHVAGVAALYLQNNPGAGPYAVASAIVNNATTGVVNDPGSGSPNRLLYSNFVSSPQFSLSLNGTSAYVDVPNSASLNITGAITVEAAIKTNVAGADQAIVERYNNYGVETSDGGYVLRLFGGKLAFITLMNGGVYDYVIGSQDISPGYWHHVAGVFDGSQLRVYVDGNLVGVKSSTFAPGTGTGNLRIGAKGDDLTIKFNGLADEVRVTADALYNANFNVIGMHELLPVANTRAYWKFNNQTANDSSGNGNNGVLVGGAGFSTDVP